jgi:hypothetical protein
MNIVERLRTIKDPPDYDSPLCFEAADKIERLQKALRDMYILALSDMNKTDRNDWANDIARAALKEDSSDPTA